PRVATAPARLSWTRNARTAGRPARPIRPSAPRPAAPSSLSSTDNFSLYFIIMNDSNRPKDFLTQALPVLVIAAVPVAAFLAFAIQPIMGKRLLPIYGGTSGTWLGCMVYFQLALLLGYSWAAWLVRKTPTFQMTATAALAVLAVVTFHLPSDEIAEAAGIAR